MENLTIVHTSNIKVAQGLMRDGHIPVECSFGQHGSVIDDFKMDHHNEHSSLESVAVRAYRDFFGKAAGQSFVVTGYGDADATFAIAALTGNLPLPKDKDLLPLATLIGMVDVDPLSVHLTDSELGKMILFWSALSGRMPATPEGFKFGINLWEVITNNRTNLRPVILAAGIMENSRIARSAAAKKSYHGELIVGIESDEWGFDVWYGRLDGFQDDHASWRHPVVVRYGLRDKNFTIGCPNPDVAERLFGVAMGCNTCHKESAGNPGDPCLNGCLVPNGEGGMIPDTLNEWKGLQRVFPKLGEGWGGREAIGGSPRGEKFKPEDLDEVCTLIEGALDPIL